MRYAIILIALMLTGCTDSKVRFGQEYVVTSGFHEGRRGTAVAQYSLLGLLPQVDLEIYDGGFTITKIRIDESMIAPVKAKK